MGCIRGSSPRCIACPGSWQGRCVPPQAAAEAVGGQRGGFGLPQGAPPRSLHQDQHGGIPHLSTKQDTKRNGSRDLPKTFPLLFPDAERFPREPGGI